jgi:hypothetical protein
MTTYQIGDIIINTSVTFGHVLMCYKPGAGSPEFIHATNKGGFSVEAHPNNGLLFNSNSKVFRAKGITEHNKGEIIKHADLVKRSAKYGSFRAIRLLAGSSEFGKGAKARLEKYKLHIDYGIANPIKTVTCSEAVMLCYQLTFLEADNQFIRLDAAHTMPETLKKYLSDSAHWIAPD